MSKKSYRDTGWGDFELNNSIGEKIQQLKDGKSQFSLSFSRCSKRLNGHLAKT